MYLDVRLVDSPPFREQTLQNVLGGAVQFFVSCSQLQLDIHVLHRRHHPLAFAAAAAAAATAGAAYTTAALATRVRNMFDKLAIVRFEVP